MGGYRPVPSRVMVTIGSLEIAPVLHDFVDTRLTPDSGVSAADFWAALEAEAARQALPVNALVARIDVERMEADDPPNLTSAIRQWLWHRCGGQTAA